MPINFLATLSYVLISSFTPGPSNISTTSLSVVHGYKNTLAFQGGLAAGVWVMMMVAAWVSASVLSLFPAIEPILRWIGAAYILYLAYSILKASYVFSEGETKPLGFGSGFVLQILNPKLVVYSLSLFATFLAPLTSSAPALAVAAAVLALIAFCATSTWALFGAVIKVYLRQPRVKVVVNIGLALMLVYTAVDLVGFL